MKKKQHDAADDRRRDLQRFIDEHRLKVSRWAAKAGLSEGTIRNYLTGRSSTLTQATIDALAEAVGVTASAIFPSQEKRRRGKAPQAAALTFMAKSPGSLGVKDLPVVGTVRAASRGTGFTRTSGVVTERPAFLKGIRSAYALRLHDPSMSPAFEPGWLLYVDPTEAVKPGDNVVIQRDGAMMIRRLVKKTKDAVIVRQFSPRADTRLSAEELTALHCVAGVRYRR